MNYMRLITHGDDPSIPEGKAVLVLDNNGYVGTSTGWPLQGKPALFPIAQAEMLMNVWTYVQLYHPKLEEMPHPEMISDKAKEWLVGENSIGG